MWDFISFVVKGVALIFVAYMTLRIVFRAYYEEREIYLVKVAKKAQEMNRNGA